MGAEGIAVFEGPAKIRRIPTAAKKVFDVTGAGDTVIASLSLALAAGLDLLSASILANAAAGITVAQVGAGVATPEELSAALHNMDPPAIETWLDM